MNMLRPHIVSGETARLSGEVYNGFCAFQHCFYGPSLSPYIATLFAKKALIITRLGGSEALEVQQVLDPQAGAGQELVRVEASG